MEQSILPIINTLISDGYTANLSGNPTQGVYLNGILLQIATCETLLVIDEQDLRIWVSAICTVCGIKGIAIH